jgi:very-short-patch-repair endonuclease
MAAVLATAGRAVASHRSAAALHGLDGCTADVVELSVARLHRVQVPNLVVHHVQALDPQDLTVVEGIPTTGLARTLCDLGSVVCPERVEKAFDDARRRQASLRWIEETATRLHRPGQAGTGVLLRLIHEARRQPSVRGSWFEKLAEDCLRSPALPALVRQHRVHDEHGRLAGILDLAFPSLRLGVEAHSRQFHFGRSAERADEDRDHRLARCGWEVLYVGWQLTKRPADLLSLVVDTARHRRVQLGEAEV